MKLLKNKRGFTLVDILIYVAILGTVLITVSALFGLTVRQRERSDVINKVTSDLSRSALVIKEEVQNIDAIDNPAQATSSSNIDFGTNSIYLQNGNLLIDNNGSVSQINSEYVNVDNFTVSNLSTSESSSVKFTLEYSHRTSSQRGESNFSDSLEFTITLNE